jgi:hypothetical protein
MVTWAFPIDGGTLLLAPGISDLSAQCRASYVSSRFGVILGTAIVADAWKSDALPNFGEPVSHSARAASFDAL